MYRILQPGHRYAEYLSSVRFSSNSNLPSSFRCGCHGLLVHTGRRVVTKQEDRLCQVCHSPEDVEDEQHFLVSCPAYMMLDKSIIMPVFFSMPFLSQTFPLTLNQMHVVVFSESVFPQENLLYPCFFMCCTLSVGPPQKPSGQIQVKFFFCLVVSGFAVCAAFEGCATQKQTKQRLCLRSRSCERHKQLTC